MRFCSHPLPGICASNGAYEVMRTTSLLRSQPVRNAASASADRHWQAVA